jgi:FTO catalytic domain
VQARIFDMVKDSHSQGLGGHLAVRKRTVKRAFPQHPQRSSSGPQAATAADPLATGACKLSKQQRRNLARNQAKKDIKVVGDRSCTAPEATTLSAYKRPCLLPPPYPSTYFKPADRFLVPEDRDYDRCLQHSYPGFHISLKESFPPGFHESFAWSLQELEPLYEFDVTQPHGLNTKLSKTYVKRCLVGEKGITYKYLGLRMFSFPWNAGETGSSPATVEIGRLNEQLIQHTEKLMKNGTDSFKSGPNSCRYNLTLINRCFEDGSSAGIDFKEEPMFKRDKATVSWHADSTLEHFSTIAVYHATTPIDEPNNTWRIAMRVSPHAEGPTSSNVRLKAACTRDGSDTPAVAVPLPNQSCYFLLDDFNHHHQHSGNLRFLPSRTCFRSFGADRALFSLPFALSMCSPSWTVQQIWQYAQSVPDGRTHVR